MACQVRGSAGRGALGEPPERRDDVRLRRGRGRAGRKLHGAAARDGERESLVGGECRETLREHRARRRHRAEEPPARIDHERHAAPVHREALGAERLGDRGVEAKTAGQPVGRSGADRG
jgi:hypothetical protein